MKRSVIIVLLGILLIGLVIAPEAPTAGVGGKDVEDIQSAIKYIPINSSGEVDVSSWKNMTSGERLESIDQWLEDYAGWLSWVFGMTPEVSLLFAINMYIWLLALVVLVLNVDKLMWGNWFVIHGVGLGVFVVGLLLKLYFVAAFAIWGFVYVVWNYAFSSGGILFAIVAMAILFGLGVVLPIGTLPKFFAVVGGYSKKIFAWFGLRKSGGPETIEEAKNLTAEMKATVESMRNTGD